MVIFKGPEFYLMLLIYEVGHTAKYLKIKDGRIISFEKKNHLTFIHECHNIKTKPQEIFIRCMNLASTTPSRLALFVPSALTLLDKLL